MRHIDLNTLLNSIFSKTLGKELRTRLERAGRKAAAMQPGVREKGIKMNGPNKWKPIKTCLTDLLGKKCWYTEVELIGASLTVDHYRPVCTYWWLAYDPENYRVACPWANSPLHNACHGRSGGKGDNFPLLHPGIPKTEINRFQAESPVILDPCNPADCDLLVFEVDGRPVLNPLFAGDADALKRVEESKILLNLDHPDFNSKREQLWLDIKEDVETFEELPAGAARRAAIQNRLKQKLNTKAPFSSAARSYLSRHRQHQWVQDILDSP